MQYSQWLRNVVKVSADASEPRDALSFLRAVFRSTIQHYIDCVCIWLLYYFLPFASFNLLPFSLAYHFLSYCRCMLCGDMSFTVCVCVCFLFVCGSLTPTTKSTNFASRYLVEGSSEEDEIFPVARCTPRPRLVTLGPGGPPGELKYWRVYKNFVTFISKLAWPILMKFGMMGGNLRGSRS